MIRSAYQERPRVGIDFKDEKSLAVQSEKDNCDINKIVAKGLQAGLVEHVNKFRGEYLDLSEAPLDYHDAMLQVTEAREAFEALPSDIRKKFRNDPAAFYDYVSDPDNQERLIEMGLAKRVQAAETPHSPAEQNVEPKGETPPQDKVPE